MPGCIISNSGVEERGMACLGYRHAMYVRPMYHMNTPTPRYRLFVLPQVLTVKITQQCAYCYKSNLESEYGSAARKFVPIDGIIDVHFNGQYDERCLYLVLDVDQAILQVR